MPITYIFGLLGGFAFFIYGMDLMSAGLELVAGDRLHKWIEKMTSSTLKGLLVGIGVTALIQSSSGTTVMVVGFVNAGLMTIEQAVGIIMGANIGTTITGQLVALDISSISPLLAFIGFFIRKFIKKPTVKYLGQVILGLGLLFMGMQLMSSSMSPLREYEGFRNLLISISNPLLGIIAGAVITAIIQASAASLGILQAIANEGLIGLHGSMYIICGFNIGTCITSVLSSIGTSKNAQRTAAVHVLFNLIGTIIFVIIAQFIPIDKFIESISRALPAAQIANMHTFFNIMATVILLPFSKYLAKLSTFIIRGKDKEQEEMSLQYINPKKTMREAATELTDIRAEAHRMIDIAMVNFKISMDLISKFEEEKYETVFHNEKILNFLNSNITRYIIDCLSMEMDENMAANYTGYMRIVRDVERIGDHAKSIAEGAKLKEDKKLIYTEESIKELNAVQTSISTMFNAVITELPSQEKKDRLKFFSNRIEAYVDDYRNEHMDRMRLGVCDPESGLVFEKTLSALERIQAYIYNVGKLIIN